MAAQGSSRFLGSPIRISRIRVHVGDGLFYGVPERLNVLLFCIDLRRLDGFGCRPTVDLIHHLVLCCMRFRGSLQIKLSHHSDLNQNVDLKVIRT